MSVRIIYFVHGTTTDNEAGYSSGWNDSTLSKRGKLQAQELGITVQEQFAHVYCSDLIRAKETAEIAFGNRATISSDARLRECNYGDLNGKSVEIVEPLQERMLSERFPNGESYEDVKVRLADFLETLRSTHQGETIAVVAHKAPQLAMDVLITGKTWEQAFAEDWRKRKAWQPGWEYTLD